MDRQSTSVVRRVVLGIAIWMTCRRCRVEHVVRDRKRLEQDEDRCGSCRDPTPVMLFAGTVFKVYADSKGAT